MKNTILILLAMLTLSGCLKENTDGCPAWMRLSFSHNESTDEFDDIIGNDVYLHVYSDDLLVSTYVIPYHEISGGKRYTLRKEAAGRMDLVAWAVPTGGDHSLIPNITESERKTDKKLRMKTITRSTYQESMDPLFLGTVTFDDVISVDSEHHISMQNCICKVTVIVAQDADYFDPDQIETPRIELYGSKSEMDLDFNPAGQEAVVSSDLSYNAQEQLLYSEQIGLLPSAEDQTLSVLAYRGNVAVFRVDTDIRSVPGDEIIIRINRNASVTVTVNGWKVKNATITDL